MGIFDHVLENVDIVDVISHYITVQHTGKNHKALCPFHSEKTPSFIISSEKQLFHCFGCGAAGNAIQFVAQYEHLDPIDALEVLAERYHIDISTFNRKGQKRPPEDLSRQYAILRDAAVFFYKNLRRHEAPKAYLSGRGLSLEVLNQFGIGYASDSWSELLDTLSKKYPVADLERAGLVVASKDKGRFYDRFRNRVMFPIIDPKGKVVGFGGRVMDDALPKYLNSPETDIFDKSQTLYGLNLAKGHKQLIVCEGYMDVIALHKAGISNAVATLGTAMTEKHGKLMRRYAEDIVICYDADFAGQNATLKALDVLEPILGNVRVVVLGEQMDPDDYIARYGVAAFREKLDSAISATAFRIERLKGDFNLGTDRGKVDFLEKAAVLINGLENPFEKTLFIERLSKELEIQPDALARQVMGSRYQSGSKYTFHADKLPATNRRKQLERQLMHHYIRDYYTLTSEEKLQIEAFPFREPWSGVRDEVTAYYDAHGPEEAPRFIEEMDIEAARVVMSVLQSSELPPEREVVLANSALLILDEQIERNNSLLKSEELEAAQADALKREIADFLLEKRKIAQALRQYRMDK